MRPKLLSIAVPAALLALLSVPLQAYHAGADNARADAALQQGRVDEAQALLTSSLQQQPQDSAAHLLLCRVYYAQEMGDQAIHECETAAGQAPHDSQTQLWLGRAYGLKASHTNMIAAFKLARKVRSSFEQAVQLDDGNIEAMNDLGDYYVQAPGVVGGGLDKAQALANRMAPRFPAQTHRLRAFAADKQNDAATAETEFKAAVATGHAPSSYIDLAGFYSRHHRAADALANVRLAVAADRAHDAVLVDAAIVLTESQQQPEMAIKLLREYLASPAKSDAAPAFKVHRQLGDLLAKSGDTAGQQAEYAAARALASGYKTAKPASGGA